MQMTLLINNMCIDATNRFYTLIPHSFGMDNPTIIDSAEQLQEKVDLIYSLLEMEIATTLLRSADDDTDDPLESHYKKLNCAMEPLDHDSDEFQMVIFIIFNLIWLIVARFNNTSRIRTHQPTQITL